jgi:hypothetical protein
VASVDQLDDEGGVDHALLSEQAQDGAQRLVVDHVASVGRDDGEFVNADLQRTGAWAKSKTARGWGGTCCGWVRASLVRGSLDANEALKEY